MTSHDYTPLLAELSAAYAKHAPASAALHKQAQQCMVDGGNHALRLIQPFPPRIARASGAWLTDEDGNRILDFWQGHGANILGHNPPAITGVLSSALAGGFGLQTGMTEKVQIEAAELLCRLTGSERVRFTTSGTLATMYAIMLARAFTGRQLVMKVGGGWHGAQPWALKGVGYQAATGKGFNALESEGLTTGVGEEVIITRFNDPDLLSAHFRQYGDRVACFIVEPFMGAGGHIDSTLEYMQTARALTQKHGALLIIDEVIAGFRFRAGDTAAIYGVKPDLATYGKIIGGGMPVAAVAGRADVMGLSGRAGGGKVRFSGGTYSAHPLSMLAAKTMLTYLVEHESEIYPYIAGLGEQARHAVETAFVEEGIVARCTDNNNGALPGSSMVSVHFPHRDDINLDAPDVVLNPALCDVELGHVVLTLALLVENVHILKGHGSVTLAHTEADVAFLAEACRRVARRVKKHL